MSTSVRFKLAGGKTILTMFVPANRGEMNKGYMVYIYMHRSREHRHFVVIRLVRCIFGMSDITVKCMTLIKTVN